MRILQVTTSARRRGAEVFASQLGTTLGARGHQVRTVALEAPTGAGHLDFTYLGHRRTDPRGIAALVRSARAADVIVAHGGSTLAPVALAGELARRPFLYRNIGDPSYWGAARAAALRVGLPLRRAAHVVALYEGAARYMIDRYALDPDRVSVAPNAVDVARFDGRTHAERIAARAELGIDDDDLVVFGYLGNLSPEKRPGWALDVVEAVDGSVLVMAGDGPLREGLAERARPMPRRMGVPACTLLGQIADPARFLAALDVLLLPSVTEGIPGVLLEAALVGVPTVATRVGGVAETVCTTGCGQVVDPEDRSGFIQAVRDVLDHPDTYLPDRTAVADHHGIDEVCDTWERILEQVRAR